MSADGPQSLPARARWLLHGRYLVSLVVVEIPGALAAGFGATFVVGVTGAAVLVGVLILAQLLYTLWWPSLSYERYTWELRSDALLLGQGVLFHDLTAIPLGRVQHVDVRQGPFERWLGLARVHVHTASGLGSDGVIPGMELADAERLRDELVARAGRGEDGV